MTYSREIAAERLGTPLHIPVHPFPVYATLFNFALYLVLAWLFKKRQAPGRVFAWYLILYGIGRFLFEYTRGDLARGFVFGGAMSTSQLISTFLLVTGIGLHLWISRRKTA